MANDDSTHILSIGEVLWDLYPEGEQFGGAPANFACQAAMQGGTVAIISAIGDDQRGPKSLRALQAYGVETALVQKTTEFPTGTVGVSLDANGKPTFEIHHNSAWDWIAWNSTLESRLTSADALYFGTLGQRSKQSRDTIRRCLEVARNAGVARILDINLRRPFYDQALIRDSIALASILKLSDDELPEVAAALELDSTAAADQLLKQILTAAQLELVVLTRGANGAWLTTATEHLRQAGVATEVRDTVGAGDSFTASFVVGFLHQRPLQTVLKQACESAARTCGHRGALPPLASG